MLDRITNIAASVTKIIGGFKPEIAIVIGSGLGSIVETMTVDYRVDYCDVEGFPRSTVEGHKGELLFGSIEGRKVVVQNGRFHYYEGYTPSEVVIAIRLFKLLGVKSVFLSNAAGAINSTFRVGDIMVIRDHINFIPNPLIGKNIAQFGERFPSMHNVYSARLVQLAMKSGVELKKGVYVALTGPSYESDAEINFLRVIGGDAVGMSTAIEAIAAVHCSLELFAVSLITNETGGNCALSHEDVVRVAAEASKRVAKLFRYMISNC